MNAIALNSSMFNGARVVGPAVAGILVARLGEGWCFFANGASYIAVIVGLLLMNVHAPAHVSTSTSPFEHIVEGFRFVDRTAPIRALMLLLGLVSVTGMPYVVLMPIFADRILHHGGQQLASLIGAHDLGAVRLGILMGATGVGALLGALTWPSFGRERFGTLGRRMLRRIWSQPDAVRAVALLLAFGDSAVAGGIFHHVADGVLEHSYSGDGARCAARTGDGCVFHDVHGYGADWSAARRSFRDRLGAPLTVAIGGFASLGGAWWFSTQLPKIRIEARQLIIAQAMVGGEPAEEMTARIVED